VGRHRVTRTTFALFAALLATSALAAERPPARLICQCWHDVANLYVADGDGQNERALLPNSGSNYNASFSADGRWIVFTSDRSGSADLYRVHADGSALEQLTNDAAFEDQGALSPDGSRLAYVSTRDGGFPNLWLKDLKTGRTRSLAKAPAGSFRPSWSPDGRWIAFSSDRDTALVRVRRPPSGAQAWEQMQFTALYVIRDDGGGLRRLTPLDHIAGGPHWSPDGRRIAYYEFVDAEAKAANAGSGRAVIRAMDLQTGTIATLSQGALRDVSPQFVGTDEVAYLSLERVEGRGITRVATTRGKIGAPRDMTGPSWSPDGKRVVYHRIENPEAPWTQRFASGDAGYQLTGGGFTDPVTAFDVKTGALIFAAEREMKGNSVPIVRATQAGREAAAIFNFDTGAPGRFVTSMAVSPDGQEIALQTGRNGDRPPTPNRIDFVGTDGKPHGAPLAGPEGAGFPSYSPDGAQVVYRVLGSEQGLRIRSKDGAVRTLTTAWDNFPAWSPRGDRIAFTRLEGDAFIIHTIRPDGSGLTRLTAWKGTDAHPVWSPDGRWLAFVSGRHGLKDEEVYANSPQSYGEVFVMRADGSALRQVTDNRYEERVIAWLEPERR
jgi:TolB protein